MFTLEELEFLAECVDARVSKDRMDRRNKCVMGMKLITLQEQQAQEPEKKPALKEVKGND